jgi:hypothetical protein
MHERTGKDRVSEPVAPYDDEMRSVDMDPANDFPEITPEVEATARRGFLSELRGRAPAFVRIDEDLRELFPSEQAVNAALRKVAELVHQVEARRAG